ncbi:MAG: DUF1559 domain-containing protein [Planctomycetota bacterium]|nr:DUF1559 domain-containing protein [Planctomycetota bacterium]
MEHGFPPGTNWQSATAETVIMHVLMLFLVIGSVAGLFLSRRRPAKKSDIWCWNSLVIGAPIGAAMVSSGLDSFAKDAARPFLIGYVLFVWLVCLVGMALCHVALKRNEEASPLGCSVSCLLSLGLTIALLLPAVPQAREAARRSQCKNNLKYLGLALHNYLDVYQSFPMASSGQPPMSWRINVAPYIDGNSIVDEYDQTQTWDAKENEHLAKRQIPVYMCPSRSKPLEGTDEQGRFLTDYTMLTGPATFSGNLAPRTPQQFTDGTSNTLAIVEAAGLNIVWTEPRDAEVGKQPLGINLKGAGEFDSPGLMSSWHVGGAHAAFADGSVRFLSQDIDPSVLKALTTVDGDEQLPQSY